MPVVVQFFDMVVDVPVVQIVDGGVQFLDTVVDMPVIVHVVFVVLKTVEVPQLQYRQGGRCLLRAGHRRFGRPCDHAATLSLQQGVPQIQFTGRVVDIPVVQQRRVHSFQQCWVMAAVKLFLAVFAHFSRSSGS